MSLLILLFSSFLDVLGYFNFSLLPFILLHFLLVFFFLLFSHPFQIHSWVFFFSFFLALFGLLFTLALFRLLLLFLNSFSLILQSSQLSVQLVLDVQFLSFLW